MKTERLLSITLYLINRKKATARELADYFEVSVRTIQRDMESLSRAGIPIYTDRGKDGGYRIIESLHGQTATILTRMNWVHCFPMVRRLNRLLNHAGLKKTEQKLLNLFAPDTSVSKHDTLIMDLTPWGVEKAVVEKFRTVNRAVETHQAIHIRYASSSGDITQRGIEPVSIIIKGAAWYVFAFCRLRSAMRLFKITRILETRLLPEFFDPSMHAPYKDTFPQDPCSTTLFVLKFAPSARGRIMDYYNPVNLHFMPDGAIMGFFPFPEDEWVYGWILSFGPLVEVLEPAHARQRIESIVNSMTKVYKK